VTEGQAAAGESPRRMNERMYLGGFEVYREYSGSSDSVMLERETLHIMDDQQRIALVETKTVTNPDDESPTQLIRFQFGNHLGSASLELDDKGGVISYEEYYPYGSTAYHAVDKGIKAAGKRYRYTGMERDDETGLSYHSARYYVPWLGRWVSCDPIGIEAGINFYCYCSDNPVVKSDQSGMEELVAPWDKDATIFGARVRDLVDVGIGAEEAALPLVYPQLVIAQTLSGASSGSEGSLGIRNTAKAISTLRNLGDDSNPFSTGTILAYDPKKLQKNFENAREAANFLNTTYNPVYSILVDGYEAREAFNRGDFRGVGRHLTNATISAAATAVGVVAAVESLGLGVGKTAAPTTRVVGNSAKPPMTAMGEAKPSILTSEPTPRNLTSKPLSSQPAGSTRLDTNLGKKFHYTNVTDPAKSFSEGVHAGTSFTGEGNLSPKAAETRLGIPRPDYVVVVEDTGQFRPNTPPTVQPVPNRGIVGGGSDYVSTELVSREQIEGIYKVCRSGPDWSLNVWK
jgi:RHS repeat-associated protein